MVTAGLELLDVPEAAPPMAAAEKPLEGRPGRLEGGGHLTSIPASYLWATTGWGFCSVVPYPWAQVILTSPRMSLAITAGLPGSLRGD